MMWFSSILIASILRCARDTASPVSEQIAEILRTGVRQKPRITHVTNALDQNICKVTNCLHLLRASEQINDACQVLLSINRVQCICRLGMVAGYSITAILHWALSPSWTERYITTVQISGLQTECLYARFINTDWSFALCVWDKKYIFCFCKKMHECSIGLCMLAYEDRLFRLVFLLQGFEMSSSAC